MSDCPLCTNSECYPLEATGPSGATYFRCTSCSLVFMGSQFHLTEEQEKQVYDQHDNQPNDPSYRQFLSRSFEQVLTRCQRGAKGLDFGCGPGPALIAMGEEAGFHMRGYDKYYRDDDEALKQQYDFITCTEVAEHLKEPAETFDQLWSLLNDGGVLVIQTKRVLDDARFASWFYKNDPTHIVFFADNSFAYLEKKWGAQMSTPYNDVVVFLKNN